MVVLFRLSADLDLAGGKFFDSQVCIESRDRYCTIISIGELKELTTSRLWTSGMMLIDLSLSLHRMTQVPWPIRGRGRGVTTDRIDHINTRRPPPSPLISI